MLSSTLRRALQKLPRRGFASSAVHQSQHLPQAAASVWIPLVGTVVAVTVIAFAPPHEFDDLDCQQVCTEGVCKEHSHTKH
jgi:hypothetical protein